MKEAMKHDLTEKQQSYYVVGESRTNADNAITIIYGSFYMAFEVDEQNETVLDFGCTHTLELTEVYLRKLFVGQNFTEINQWLEVVLDRRYGGSSKKAVLVAYQNALKRYQLMKRSERRGNVLDME